MLIPKGKTHSQRSYFKGFKGLLGALLATITTLVIAKAVWAASELPDLGDRSAVVISSVEEEKLGREFMRNARQKLKFIDDAELNAYLRQLGNNLVAHSDAPQQKFHFYIVQDPTLNAFAVPGGHVTVHTGLITAAETESELAAVIAHEIAHVSQRHLPRMFAKMQQQSLPALAGLVAAILLGGQAGQAALIATNAKMLENQLRYSRDFEREADAIGIRTLAGAGFEPRAIPGFFQRLEQWGRIHDFGAPAFLRTHPITSDRVADSEARAEAFPRAHPAGQSEFFHIRAKIRALYTREQPSEAVKDFAANLAEKQYEDLDAERYGYVLALTAADNYDLARAEADKLVTKYPRNIRYLVSRAEIEVQAGRYQTAVEWYRKARQLAPASTALDSYQANALIKAGFYGEARDLLRKATRRDPDQRQLFSLLAQAEEKTGNYLAAYQASAEYYYLQGDLGQALRHLQQAKKYTGDSFYAQASIDARIQAIRDEIALANETP